MEPSAANSESRNSSTGTPDTPPILFFDGECVMCNWCVDFVLWVNGGDAIRFAPLQGETANERLDELPDSRESWTIYLLDEQGLHNASEAALRLFDHIGGAWQLLSLLRWIPVSLRDAVYRFVARHRYWIFGRKDACRVPLPHEEERFLP